MSEAELHILKARMRGGQLNKARRGELEMGPPVGLIYKPGGVIDLDPDAEVQGAIRLVFDTFDRLGSAVETVGFFRDQGIPFPRRLRSGPNKGDLLWALPQHARILQVLRNPRYAGAFVYGRTRTRRRPDGGTTTTTVPRAEWQIVMPGAHHGYINWDRFEANQQRLADNARAYDNRLVADALEAEWNDKLRAHTEAVEDHGRRGREEIAALDAEARQRILDLARRFPAIWQDPRVDHRERKRILRLLIDDVTLIKAESITAHVRLRGGATRTLQLDRPLPIAQIRKFKPGLVAEVDRLLDQHCDREIADILNQRGYRTWEDKPFNLKKVAFIRDAYKLAR
jgi:hypothetical protein